MNANDYDYVLVRLQYNLEFSEEFMKQEVEKLCDLFGFYSEFFVPEGETECVFFNIYFCDDPLFSSTYADIVKLFALQEGLLLLGTEYCPRPLHLDKLLQP